MLGVYIIYKYNYLGYGWTLSQLLSASTQGVTYIILTDCTYCSLSNYTYILYIPPSTRNNPYGKKENDIQPDTPGTMVPRDIMRSPARPITPQDHYTHGSIA